MDPIVLVGWGWERTQEMEIWGLVLGQNLGERCQNFREAFPVPDWRDPVHWRRHEERPFRISLTNLGQNFTDVLKNWIDALGDGVGTGGA